MNESMGVVLCLDALAWSAAARNEPARALTLSAAAEAAWAAIPAAPPAPLRRHHDTALAVFILVVAKPRQSEIESVTRSRGLVPCPHCAEPIKHEANVCRYCQRDVPAAAVSSPV